MTLHNVIPHFNYKILTKPNTASGSQPSSTASEGTASGSTASGSTASGLTASTVLGFLSILKKRIVLSFEGDILEKNVMRELISKLFEPLAVDVKVERRQHLQWVRENYGHSNSTVHAGSLGMGIETQTWYGTIDARLRGHGGKGDSGAVLLLDHDCDEDGMESDGTTVAVELKRKGKGISQAIGSAILASFVDNKLHPEENPVFPCIFLNCTKFRVILYDCKKDVLLITEDISLYKEGSRQIVSKFAIFVLWIIINHR